jgi:hypothetical protein
MQGFCLKLKLDIMIDAARETVWDAFDKVNDDGKWVVTDKHRPDFIAGNYITAGSRAVVVNHFEQVAPQRTKWIVFANYRFTGAMKFLSFFGAGKIRDRTMANMERFKLFVETQVANEKP